MENFRQETLFELYFEGWAMCCWIKIRIGIQAEFTECPEEKCETTCRAQKITNNLIKKNQLYGGRQKQCEESVRQDAGRFLTLTLHNGNLWKRSKIVILPLCCREIAISSVEVRWEWAQWRQGEAGHCALRIPRISFNYLIFVDICVWIVGYSFLSHDIMIFLRETISGCFSYIQ